MPTRKATVPIGLTPKGRKFWHDVTSEHQLRVDELRILEDACREIDLIARLDAELRKKGSTLVVNGSMGQPVANPLVAEVRQHRNTLKGLLASLKLPDDPDEAKGKSRSTSAREAAAARWGQRGA